MSFNIEYKTNKDQVEWSVMSLKFSYFNSLWDEEQLAMEIMEYVYTESPEDDEEYEENCSLKDKEIYIQKIQNHFNGQLKKEDNLIHFA